MSVLTIQNGQSFVKEAIRFLTPDEFHSAVAEQLEEGGKMTALMPVEKNNPLKIIAVTANSNSNQINITGGNFTDVANELKTWADKYPQTNYFECELAENYGYVPLGHPWLRPVRKQTNVGGKKYEFFRLEGEEVHEVAVGPIHAGVIEPGHFRFQCHGELVYNLEINLGYQHRNVEQLMIDSISGKRTTLAESIAGDTAIGHVFAHCGAMESLAGCRVPLKAEIIRTIAAEIERIAMHIAGLTGIANDVGFALPASFYGGLRTLAINSLAALCGSRFGRGLFKYGGVRYDFSEQVRKTIIDNLLRIQREIKQNNDFLFSSVGALSRFEETGKVSKEFAESVGLVGMAARACGVDEDIRINFPYSAYRYSPVSIMTLSTGDVFARARLRSLEINESLRYVLEQLENLPEGAIESQTAGFAPDSCAIALIEGWRGQIAHLAFTDSKGKISNYKVKDPSFNNWYGLSLALRNTAISDFPLCNKSFDLSYAGHDL